MSLQIPVYYCLPQGERRGQALRILRQVARAIGGEVRRVELEEEIREAVIPVEIEDAASALIRGAIDKHEVPAVRAITARAGHVADLGAANAAAQGSRRTAAVPVHPCAADAAIVVDSDFIGITEEREVHAIRTARLGCGCEAERTGACREREE